MLQSGEVLKERYEIIKMIGKGGMSTVYQAQDLVDKKLLAVKDVERSSREQNQVVEQSLSAEGRMLMQLSNPHLPRIYEIIENQDNFMLVMDFIQGESLDKLIAREGAQSMDKVLDWGMQICEVFHYLHSQTVPIIYRDMKPANVMLQPNGQLMMIDFGTARTEKVGVAMQADTICIGTAGFAAPEQFGGIGQSTARTDIFCLGATLYNLITGHSPCEWPAGILPLGQWDPALSNTPLEEIITKCTRNDPDERYQTAMELHEDLRLASIGAYRSGSKKGFSGNLWQKQDNKNAGMITGGLSSLLQKGKSELTISRVPERTTQASSNNGWQTGTARAAIPEHQAAAQQHQGQGESMTHKLLQICVLVALIFAVLAIVLVLGGSPGAAIVFLVVAVAAAVAAVVFLLKLRNQNTY